MSNWLVYAQSDAPVLVQHLDALWTAYRDQELTRLGRRPGASVDSFVGTGLEAPLVTVAYAALIDLEADGFLVFASDAFIVAQAARIGLVLVAEAFLPPDAKTSLARIGPNGKLPPPAPKPQPDEVQPAKAKL